MKYVYPAIFCKYDDPESNYTSWDAKFPDFGWTTYDSRNLFEAICKAENELARSLIFEENHGIEIPKPSKIKEIELPPDDGKSRYFLTLIKVDTDAYRLLFAEEEFF